MMAILTPERGGTTTTQGAQEPFYLGRLGKAQRRVMTDLMGKDKSLPQLWGEGQVFQGVLSVPRLAACGQEE